MKYHPIGSDVRCPCCGRATWFTNGQGSTATCTAAAGVKRRLCIGGRKEIPILNFGQVGYGRPCMAVPWRQRVPSRGIARSNGSGGLSDGMPTAALRRGSHTER